MSKITLLPGDCLERMTEIPAGSIDMILCDLPYGTTQNKWDAVIPFDAMWSEYRRIIKKGGAIILTASQPFTSALIMSNIKNFKYSWIWEKNVASNFMDAKRKPLKIHEDVCVFYSETPSYNPQMEAGVPYTQRRAGKDDTGSNYGAIKQRTDTVNSGVRYPKSIIQVARETGLHPTQKPVELMEYLIKTYTNEGETILDNCAGSGTAAVAALNTGRNAILIERDRDYCHTILKRLAA
jgi:site-specific DNA-methyltransferase (adenine-specific)